MPVISQSVAIHTSPKRVFAALVADPARIAHWLKPLTQHEILQREPRFVGTRVRYAYMLQGMRVKGEYTVVDFVPSQYLFLRTLSGMNAALEIVLQPNRGSTTVELALNYALPGALFGSTMHRPALEGQIEQDFSTMLHHLKSILEQEGTPHQKNSPRT
jgi:uncharacterized protein YndB with AHSA1/START domain